MRLHLAATLLAASACARTTPARELEHDQIRPIVEKMRLRTDTVGEGKWVETSAFVLVDAENRSSENANVTLGGELVDAAGTAIATLKATSLYVPAHETRMFALVDSERRPRPDAKGAKIFVRGATVATEPPRTYITDLHKFDDHDRVVVQAYVVNDAERAGQVIVTAAFHDAQGFPMTRPFRLVHIAGHDDRRGDDPGTCPDVESGEASDASKCAMQFFGPPGSKDGTIFLGDAVY